MNGLTRGSAAIVGAAESDIGAVAALMSPIDLMAQGIHRALADCGLTLTDVDGVFCATTQARTSAMSLVRVSRPAGRLYRLHHRRRLVVRGACRARPGRAGGRAVLGRGDRLRQHAAHRRPARAPARANTTRTRRRSGRSCRPPPMPWRRSRHMHEFGTTREQLAEVAVAAREWALLNPAAWEKKPLTDRRRAERAADQRPVHRARLLPGHRRRRRDRA